MSTATQETIQVQGVSGSTFTLWVYPWGQEFNAVGGVYVVLRVVMGTPYVLYVGQTGDLSERFDNHHKKPCFDRNGRTHVAVLVENSEARRLQIEADLILKYRPACNDAI